MINTIKSEILQEEYYEIKHKSGLTVYVYPKQDFNSTYAVFCTEYGSINTRFTSDNKKIEVPDGIAHYLEHKMFESKDGDMFLRYAKTGASANAYTSFDKTAYLFSTSDNFKESFEILIDLIQEPYFTDENVDKERGIIGQEIKMYDDDPNWRIFTNLLKNMYHNHAVKIDIAGTVESISEITKEKLYECYNAFYNMYNMTLAVVGNITPEDVIEILDNKIKETNIVKVESEFQNEPCEVVNSLVEENMGVGLPIFCLGFKETATSKRISTKELAIANITLEILAGRSSELYKKLIENNLTNSFSFDFECFEGPKYLAEIFSGQSNNPKECAREIYNYIDMFKNEGINENVFKTARNEIYGRTIAMYNSNQAIATALIDYHFANRNIFDYIKAFKEITVNDIQIYLNEHFDKNKSTLSIIK